MNQCASETKQIYKLEYSMSLPAWIATEDGKYVNLDHVEVFQVDNDGASGVVQAARPGKFAPIRVATYASVEEAHNHLDAFIMALKQPDPDQITDFFLPDLEEDEI